MSVNKEFARSSGVGTRAEIGAGQRKKQRTGGRAKKARAETGARGGELTVRAQQQGSKQGTLT